MINRVSVPLKIPFATNENNIYWPLAIVYFPMISGQAPKLLPETVSEQTTVLQEMLTIGASWEPVDQIIDLDVIPLLLRIIDNARNLCENSRR